MSTNRNGCWKMTSPIGQLVLNFRPLAGGFKCDVEIFFCIPIFGSLKEWEHTWGAKNSKFGYFWTGLMWHVWHIGHVRHISDSSERSGNLVPCWLFSALITVLRPSVCEKSSMAILHGPGHRLSPGRTALFSLLGVMPPTRRLFGTRRYSGVPHFSSSKYM